ncbi:MAG: creatininase family protein [Arenicellales bacterium]|nr:creatininase family protein [Arenicellales bacterium]
MKLETATSREVADYLDECTGIVLPTGSLEQHGPIGLIGTDALCVTTISEKAAVRSTMLIAPTLCYTPAQFNMNFAGTVSVTARTFAQLFEDILRSLHRQGFKFVYVLNGHGANLAPMRSAVHDLYLDLDDRAPRVKLRSWWEYPTVNALRNEFFGDREGMHGTPSEVAITQASVRVVESSNHQPPASLSEEFIRDHTGDFHGPASQHARDFPDGRVGSHSELANIEHGEALIAAAASALIDEFTSWMTESD